MAIISFPDFDFLTRQIIDINEVDVRAFLKEHLIILKSDFKRSKILSFLISA